MVIIWVLTPDADLKGRGMPPAKERIRLPIHRKEIAMRHMLGAIIVLTVTAASAAIVMASCSRSGESNAGRHPLPEEPAMKHTVQNMSSPGTIPPIDAAAPSTFDTATFGLG